VQAQEATSQLSLSHLSRAEEELSEEERLAEALRMDARELTRATEATEATSEELKSELGEEQLLCGLHGQELKDMEKLEEQVQAMKTKNSDLTSEHSDLQESARKSKKHSDKHFSDMHEAVRRTLRLKAQHIELVEPINGRREAMGNNMDQSLGRMSKKADAVISCSSLSARAALAAGPPGAAKANRPQRSLREAM